MENIDIVPPPWNLEGNGYILLYHFSREEINNSFFLSQKFLEIKKGGIGAIIIANYKKSPVGPYEELLIIPGKFSYGNKKRGTISKIFVSTKRSVVSGINNWAIPKEEAKFTFTEEGKNLNKIKAKKDNKLFFEIALKNYGPRFPINTRLLPFPLIQEKDELAYYTNFKGGGIGQLCSVKKINIDKNIFPDISNKNPFLSIKINPFRITFPPPKITKIPEKNTPSI